MISAAIATAVREHKRIGRALLDSSEVEITIQIEVVRSTPLVGSPLFADISAEEAYETKGPFKVIWIDADSARVGAIGREFYLLSRFMTAEVVIKVWLEDVLVDPDDPYGQTFFDKALGVYMGSRKYEFLGYDRFGLGTTQPYMLAVALRGTHED